VLVLTFLCLWFGGKHIAIAGIELYQCYVSPYKRYKCAYAVHFGDLSCSEYGKQVIARRGVIAGTVLLFQRLQTCQETARQAEGQKTGQKRGRKGTE
jgi:putative component of membrane protein insertase Oxa1/YidC/SpoIIIJ protein YidD